MMGTPTTDPNACIRCDLCGHTCDQHGAGGGQCYIVGCQCSSFTPPTTKRDSGPPTKPPAPEASPARGASSVLLRLCETNAELAMATVEALVEALVQRDRLLAALKEMVECGVSDATSAAILEARAAIAACEKGES